MPSTALLPPDPSDQKARAKAFAIRKKATNGSAQPGELSWLGEYNRASKQRNRANNATKATAARTDAERAATPPPDPPPVAAAMPSTMQAASSRKLTHIEEETRVAQASGDPVLVGAAMAAATAREEGRRYDYLLEAAVGSQRFVIEQLLKRNEALERAQIALMESIRAQYVARTQAEIDGMRAVADARLEAETEAAGSGEMSEAKIVKFMEQVSAMLPMVQGMFSAKTAGK
jgi:hypothetical protein